MLLYNARVLKACLEPLKLGVAAPHEEGLFLEPSLSCVEINLKKGGDDC